MKIFSEELVEKAVADLHIADLSKATIGEVLLTAQYLEKQTGIPFVRMDQGSPGLPVNRHGVEAEKAALDRGVGSQYPAAAGVPELKYEASRFVKAFMDIDISPRSCVPTVGSVAGSYGSFIALTQRTPGKDKVLFIDPGFPIQKSQLRIIGAAHLGDRRREERLQLRLHKVGHTAGAVGVVDAAEIEAERGDAAFPDLHADGCRIWPVMLEVVKVILSADLAGRFGKVRRQRFKGGEHAVMREMEELLLRLCEGDAEHIREERSGFCRCEQQRASVFHIIEQLFAALGCDALRAAEEDGTIGGKIIFHQIVG